MKNYSKNMIEFLSESGALEGTENEVKKAKIEWRRKYKREWRKKSKKSKELRPCFTPAEFSSITERAKLYSLNPTSYARDLILSAQTDTVLIPSKDKLLHVLQALSMANIAFTKDSNSIEVQALTFQAESMLLQYLKIKE